MAEKKLDLDALIHDEAVSNLIWPDFLKEQEIIYNGHYVEDFEEDYSENFEDERKVEIFEQGKEEKSSWDIKKATSLLYQDNTKPVHRDFLFCAKPIIVEGEHK